METRHSKEEILKILSTNTKIVVRGPKPTKVCKINDIPIAVTAPEPNTWKEILTILGEEKMLAGKRVGVLEYGISNTAFIEELEKTAAEVIAVPVYKWALPDDVGPLHRALDSIIEGKVDLALFTSAIQVDNMLQVARDRRQEAALRRAFAKVGIFSIGPMCSEKLRDLQFFPDEEVFPNKMDQIVELAAQKGNEVVERKRKRASQAWIRVEESSRLDKKEEEKILHDSLLMKACRREKNDRVPIWLMRQAGRYMAEYQMIRQKVGFLDLCKNSDLASEVTVTAVERLGVDAAIIFADILLILEPMGVGLDFLKGAGPTIHSPVRNIEAIKNLKEVDVEASLGFVLEAIRKTRRAMHPRIPLIGFSGCPFTIASYMIEGKGSKNYIPTKTLMYSEPKAWHLLMEKLAVVITNYLNAQIKAGAQLVQLFDSWVGTLSPEDYREYVLPHTQRVIQGIQKGTPVIHFGTGTATLLNLQKEAGGDVIGVDWRTDIKKAWDDLGDVGVMGNLDPVILFSKPEVIFKEAEKILKKVGSRPGFIFNLGHGILPETPVDHVMALVDFVHEWGTR